MVSLRISLTLTQNRSLNTWEERKERRTGARKEKGRGRETGKEKRKWKVKKEEGKEGEGGGSEQRNESSLWQLSCPPSFLEDPQQ